ncbi:MASE4 domain-containing protein, partial [Belnapia sp. T18]
MDGGQILSLETLATAAPSRRQRLTACLVCLAFAAATFALLPIASRPLPPMPGFIPAYQSALIAVYALTTYLFFSEYRRARSVPLLILGAGSLYVSLTVFLQILSFPGVFAPERLLGSGPDTTIWLWTFWHLGPPLFALGYAALEGDGRRRPEPRGRSAWLGWLAAGLTVATAAAVALGVTRFVHLLPKSVEGDNYTQLTTSGIGPAVLAVSVIALAVLWRQTRLRTALQLWLAVSLFLLVLDNAVTLPGAARGTVGWLAGRLGALLSGVMLLAVYVRQV